MRKFFTTLDKLDEYIAVAALSVTVILLGIQVVSRFFFGISFAWAEEISRFSFVWAVYMGISMAARKNEHVRVIAHLKVLSPKHINKIVIAADIVTLIFSMALTLFGVQMLFSMVDYPYKAPATGISMVWIYTIVPIAGLTLFIRTIQVNCLKLSGKEFNEAIDPEIGSDNYE